MDSLKLESLIGINFEKKAYGFKHRLIRFNP